MSENKEKKPMDVEIVCQGNQIVLPEHMTKPEAVDHLQRKIKEDETTVAVNEYIEGFPWDAAYAFCKVLKEHFGWATIQAKIKEGLFGPMVTPPQSVSIEIAHGQYDQVLFGQFTVPNVEGVFESAFSHKNMKVCFTITGTVKKKDLEKVKEFAQLVRVYVREHSLYRGKAIRLKQTEDGYVDTAQSPTFIDTTKVDEKGLIFESNLLEQVRTNLFTPIEKTELCRQNQIPLKRGILMAGSYGTGKTLTAYVVAKKCEEHAWTYLYLPNVKGLSFALELAQKYSPCVIFAEDIDAVMGGARDAEINDILNTIDGVESKSQEIMVILSSNAPEKIEKAMLRPGRLDAVLHFVPPDAKAVVKLIELYARGKITKGENLTKTSKILAGEIPAVIREVVERSKLYALGRGEDEISLRASDFERAALGMKEHLKLLRGNTDEKTIAEKFGESFKDLVGQSFNGSAEKIQEMHRHIVE